MKRSNRLVLLVGVFLAIVAFVGILLLTREQPQGNTQAPPTTGPVVVALTDIPLSTRIQASQVGTITVDLKAIPPDAFADPSQVIGQIVRQPVAKGAQITTATLSGGAPGTLTDVTTPAGMRAIAVQVDQVTGVGTIIQTGDYVDMVVGMTANAVPLVLPGSITKLDDGVYNHTTTKLLIQGLQVLGTLLPPASAPAEGSTGSTASPAPGGSGSSGTALNGQSEIVILAVTPDQAEVVKFAQIDGNISLVLRSPDDFIDPTTGQPLPPTVIKTNGIILKTLVDKYGVLPPQVVETVLPAGVKP